MSLRILTAAVALAACGSAHAGDGFTLGTGLDYSSGKYGTSTDTEILAVPVTATWTHGMFSARVSTSWLHVTGDPNVLPGIGSVDNGNPLGRGRLPLLGGTGTGTGTPTTSTGTQRGTASGIGDTIAALTWSLPLGSKAGIDLGANAKFATADANKGLGTGANDYGATIDLYRDFDGTLLFGGGGYKWLGSSRYINLDTMRTANLGVAQAVGGNDRIGAMFEYRSAISSQREPRQEATLFYTHPTASGGKLQLYASHGFTDSSPDWGGGVAISKGF